MNQKEKKEGDGKDSPSFCNQPYLFPPPPNNNSSFYSSLPLLSTSTIVAKQENSVLDPPKEYAFTVGCFSYCSFLPWTSPACQYRGEVVKSHCHGGKIYFKNLLPWQCDVTLLFLITVLLLEGGGFYKTTKIVY